MEVTPIDKTAPLREHSTPLDRAPAADLKPLDAARREAAEAQERAAEVEAELIARQTRREAIQAERKTVEARIKFIESRDFESELRHCETTIERFAGTHMDNNQGRAFQECCVGLAIIAPLKKIFAATEKKLRAESAELTAKLAAMEAPAK